jgi:hypothetical protein
MYTEMLWALKIQYKENKTQTKSTEKQYRQIYKMKTINMITK